MHCPILVWNFQILLFYSEWLLESKKLDWENGYWRKPIPLTLHLFGWEESELWACSFHTSKLLSHPHTLIVCFDTVGSLQKQIFVSPQTIPPIIKVYQAKVPSLWEVVALVICILLNTSIENWKISQILPLKVGCWARGLVWFDVWLWRQHQIIPSDILGEVPLVIGRGTFYISLSDPLQTVSNAVLILYGMA